GDSRSARGPGSGRAPCTASFERLTAPGDLRPAALFAHWPLHDRRGRLEDVVAGSELVFPVRRLARDRLDRARYWQAPFPHLTAVPVSSQYLPTPSSSQAAASIPRKPVDGSETTANGRAGLSLYRMICRLCCALSARPPSGISPISSTGPADCRQCTWRAHWIER